MQLIVIITYYCTAMQIVLFFIVYTDMICILIYTSNLIKYKNSPCEILKIRNILQICCLGDSGFCASDLKEIVVLFLQVILIPICKWGQNVIQ